MFQFIGDIAVSLLPLKLSDYSRLQLSAFLGISLLLYLISLVIYRLYLSPLAKVPGRKIAALTPWYEFYFEYIKPGRYTWEIKDMHAKYGPIVRISPREVTIDDPDFYDVLFNQRLDKDPWVSSQFAQDLSTQATAPSELHRSRRAAISFFFSQVKIAQFQSVITDKTEVLCGLLSKHQRRGTAANMYTYYRAFTTDVITEYAFLKGWDFLNRPDAGQKYFDLIKDALATGALLRHFPCITPIMDNLPTWLAVVFVPDLKAQYEIETLLEADINAITSAGPDGSQTGKKHPQIFRELLFSGTLPPSEKHLWRLMAEGGLLVVAGNETTGNPLSVLHYHLLANPDKLARLKAELAAEIKDQWEVPSWQQLKKLPYLSACVDEILRLSTGVPHRLARLAPKGGLQWRDWTIPEGTPVSMSIFQMHLNPDIFPRPNDFWPERWLEPEAKSLKKYLAPFSRGPRVCLGMELAYAELYLATAMIQRRFDTELFETAREDIDLAHDYFLGYSRDGSKGLQIKLK